MNCSEFKKEINNFIDNTIDETCVDKFIEHYKSCPACNEELEIYYMVNKTFKNSSPNGNTYSIPNSFDFKKRLEQKISRYEEIIYHNYKVDFLMRILISTTELVSMIMVLYFILFII